jgi:hypothetical protein
MSVLQTTTCRHYFCERQLDAIGPSISWRIRQFRALIHRGFPGHECPHRKAMTQRLEEGAQRARIDIKERFPANYSRIGLELDCWITPNRWEFMSMFSPYGASCRRD